MNKVKNKKTIKQLKEEDYIREEKTYSCKLCSRPIVYKDAKGIKEHINKCLYNKENKSCVMCKHLRMYQDAPYPKLNQNWKDIDVQWAFGSYAYPYCMLKEELITEEEALEYHEECFEDGSDTIPEIVKTEEYEKYLELLTKIDNEEQNLNIVGTQGSISKGVM